VHTFIHTNFAVCIEVCVHSLLTVAAKYRTISC